MSPDGFISLNKPVGPTSQQAVSKLKRIVGSKKAGHTGTLDPAAGGLLLVGLGRATRLNEYFLDADKGYRAEIFFGSATDSGDREGQVIDEISQFSFSQTKLQQVLQDFLGDIQQVPPLASALKVQGQRAYKLYQRGEKLELPPRKVTIKDITVVQAAEVIDPGNPKITIDVLCSKGTYIRSLARDIGQRLGIPSHLAALTRTRIGSITLDMAAEFADLEAHWHKFLLDMAVAVKNMPKISLSSTDSFRFINGQKLVVQASNGQYAVFSQEKLLGVAQVQEGILKPQKVFVQE